MGTRSLTTFIDTYTGKNKMGVPVIKKEKIVTMYRQFDGYPEGHGLDLAEFLAGGKMVNGLGDGGSGIKIETTLKQLKSYSPHTKLFLIMKLNNVK